MSRAAKIMIWKCKGGLAAAWMTGEARSDWTNSLLVAALKELWEKGQKAGEVSQFVNIAGSVLADPA